MATTDTASASHSTEHTTARAFYRPLSTPTNIRLLFINSRTDEESLSGSLREFTIEDALDQDYIAISYAWGKPNPSIQLILDGNVLQVTESIGLFMWQLRAESISAVWIDQICINQDNLEERGSQVPLMKRIYEGASQVFVWLGKLDEDVETIFNCATDVVASLEAIHDDKSMREMAKQERCYEIVSAHISSEMLCTLFNREWFFRMWTIQEVVTASGPVVIRSGSLQLEFDTLSSLATLISQYCGRSIQLTPSAQLGFELFNDLRVIQDPPYYDRVFTTSSRNKDLLDLICATWRRKCTDPRDRIYALAGLSHPNHLPYPPSYIESVAVIYMDFALHRIMRSGSLRMLEWCRLTEHRLPGLPSWVPDFSALRASLGTPWIQREKQRIYSAGGKKHGKYQDMAISRPKRALTLRGALVDRLNHVFAIGDLYKYQYASAGIAFEDMAIGSGIESLLEICGPLTSFHQPWEEFWRILVCDKSVNGRGRVRAIPEDEKTVRVFINYIIYEAQMHRFEMQQRLISENRLNSTIEQMKKPQYGEAMERFRTRPPDLIQLPSNSILRYFKLKAIVWDIDWHTLKNGALRRLRWFWSKIKPLPVNPHRFTAPTANPDNQFEAINEMGPLFRYIAHCRSFAITASGRCAWVPDTAATGDEVALILAYDLPLIVRRVDDTDENVSKSALKDDSNDRSPNQRPDAYRYYSPDGYSSDGRLKNAINSDGTKLQTAWPDVESRVTCTGETHQIVGEAYVHGLMDGDMLEDASRAGVREIVFV